LDNKELETKIQLELAKEREWAYEEQRLKDTLSIINSEILSYVDKRKDLAQYILDYRKNVIEEYRDDEDKLMEYFDHERYAKEEAFRAIDRKLKEYTILLTNPYFGRVDFKEEGFLDIDSIYVGRFGVMPENSSMPVVVDWRAPAASLFYTGSLGAMHYNAPQGKVDAEVLLKRQYIIKKGMLKGMFDSALDIKDDILQMVLSSSSGEKLKDIIMTIQEEQDNIIRQPREKTLVVDGVAGSGKTTIALHRVAYLLYNYRNILQNKVLILGPNSIFMEYIRNVLPSLGEIGVRQQTFNEYAQGLTDVYNIMSFKDYMERVLSKDEAFIEEVRYKNSMQYLKDLQGLVEDIERRHSVGHDVTYLEKLVVSAAEIEELFNKYYVDMPLHRRKKKIKRIIFAKLRDVRDEAVRDINEEYKKAVEALSKDERQVDENNLNFVRKLKIRGVIEELIQCKSKLGWLKPQRISDIYNVFNGEKTYTQDDLAPMLYLMIRLEGIRDKDEIKHLVIDEAQDYSALQFMVLKEITGCKSFTIVGDSNQRLVPLEEEPAMLRLNELFKEVQVEHFKLSKSYRSTVEIMDYANGFIADSRVVPLVRRGNPVKEEKLYSFDELQEKLPEAIDRLLDMGCESIAIIGDNLKDTEKAASYVKKKSYIKFLDSESIHYTGGVAALPSYFAKGMEFDGVILMLPESSSNRERLNYVMCTRALHELMVFKY